MNRRTLLGAAAALPFAGSALAQTDFPSRPLNMVVAFPPGGQADLAARPTAAAMEKILGQAVVVQNRGGAAGAIGNAFVARSVPDGYTTLMALSSLAVIPEAEKLFGRTPPYTVDQFAPIALVNADPTMLAVPASAPWQTMEEFIAAAKARPGDIPYGSSGTYGTLHVAMEMLAAAAGFRALHVPFSGAGPAITALLGGQVQALASAPGTLTQHVQSGRVRVLGCWGKDRVAAFPDVPTFMEKGFSEVEFYIWAGLFAPAATPAPVQQKLRDAVRQAVRDPQLVAAFTAAGAPVAYLDAPEFATFFAEDSARLLRAVQRIGKVE
ncbi:Bug family tripartite tricarboxylate transporter substrate binding protein [Falsiroseomonas tokyonensis]|uniref:Bug family tripartite tricarboxylate transporter substrate binding protein n=1 Tax=Falsiroseomonas tokyonensis TaxID=430521 RepID=A0ABV7BPT8_9PROT|nr:tripartite tricarboxylate transporter substrate binding protein [Falsiroseomonas tokyonensis]MBU8537565.1 tripartite tricarboxylate transporter substrate binding protein [Falsiroseomonas tokyonensis]